MVVKHGSWLQTLKKRIQAFEIKCPRKLLHISYLQHKTNNWMQTKIKFFMGPQESFLARDGNLHGLGMLHAMTASPKPSFRAPWWVGNVMVGRKMQDGQHHRMDTPAHARTAHNGLLQTRLEEVLCWIICRVPLMTQSVKGFNWTDAATELDFFETGITSKADDAGSQKPVRHLRQPVSSWSFYTF